MSCMWTREWWLGCLLQAFISHCTSLAGPGHESWCQLTAFDIQRPDFRRRTGVSCAVANGLCMRPPVVPPPCVTAPPSMSPLTHAPVSLHPASFLWSAPFNWQKSLLSLARPFEFPARAAFLYLWCHLLPVGANINDDILYKVHQVHEISLNQTRAFYTRSLSYLEIHPGLCQNRGGKGSCWNCFWTSFLGSWSSLKSIFVRQNHSQHGFIHLNIPKPTFDRHFTD